MITHVAIRFQDKIYALPKPNRHDDVIRLILRETGVECVNASGDDQGFLDENGTYYRRAPALVHALANNQIKDLSDIRQNKLFSDNVW